MNYKKIGDIVAVQQNYKVLIGALSKNGSQEKAETLALRLKNKDKEILL